MNIPLVSRLLPPPLVMKVPLLLAEICAARIPTSQNSLAAELHDRRGVKMTGVLRQIIYHTAWCHGGINE